MRLIDADAIKYKQQVMYKKDDSDDVWAEWFTTATEINNAPTVDAEPVVRCANCKFAHMTYGGECKYCDVWESEESLYLDGDFFCAFGERKDND